MSAQVEALKAKFGAAIGMTETDRAGCPIVCVKRESVIEVLKHLRDADDCAYQFMADLTCYDNQGTDDESKFGRFVVVYNLFSPQFKNRFRVKCAVDDGVSVPTATVLWDAANWAEREVFDMFGVKFDGHPDLRRILMDVRWEGHPLRKDYYWRKYQLFNEPEQIPEHLLKDQ